MKTVSQGVGAADRVVEVDAQFLSLGLASLFHAREGCGKGILVQVRRFIKVMCGIGRQRPILQARTGSFSFDVFSPPPHLALDLLHAEAVLRGPLLDVAREWR